jgi:hypothetical protein
MRTVCREFHVSRGGVCNRVKRLFIRGIDQFPHPIRDRNETAIDETGT